LADALERFAARVLASLRKELKAEQPSPRASPMDIPPPPIRPASPSPGRLKERTEQRHAEIHELMAQGLSLSAIARRLRLNRKTVRRFARAGVAADLVASRGRSCRNTALDPSLPYLAHRWQGDDSPR